MFKGPLDLAFAQMRSVANGYLPGTAIIEVVTNASDGAGGIVPSWSPVTNGTVGCLVNPLSFGQIETLAAAIGVRVQYAIQLPYNAPIVVGNRVQVDGVEYMVRWMQNDINNPVFIKAYINRDE